MTSIDSRLSEAPERAEAQTLASNKNLSFMGGKLVGDGLAVSRQEYDQLIASNQGNAEILRPILGGEEVNQSFGSERARYMIDFTSHSLESAERWPDLLNIARVKVKPDRDKNKRQTYQTYWWRPGESGGAMYAALKGMKTCLVTANVTKHLSFTFQDTSLFFNQTLYVFAINCRSGFAALQSRVHEPWARLLSSSMRTDLRYAASDCFETFPFPQADPRAVIPALEDVGERLYTARAAYMIDTQQGLTQTYNQLKDPRCQEPRVVALRRLHEEMDRAVLAAYGWDELVVPPYGTPGTDAETLAVARFEDEVIDRLFALNAQRAAEEKAASAAAGATAGGKAKGAKRGKKADAEGGKGGSGQGELGIG
ncbi:MAG: hypothetical protein Q8S73_13525 [Deltaproteobacteria bacterium]|nr:hypothetical protein [Deltaproteobacteria bacterium]